MILSPKIQGRYLLPQWTAAASYIFFDVRDMQVFVHLCIPFHKHRTRRLRFSYPHTILHERPLETASCSDAHSLAPPSYTRSIQLETCVSIITQSTKGHCFHMQFLLLMHLYYILH